MAAVEGRLMMAADSPRGKRRYADANPPGMATPKSICFQFYALPCPATVTPKEDEELKLRQAGLGMRRVSLPEDADHVQIADTLCTEYPKIHTLKGSWNFYKAAGGRGRRRLTIVSPQVEGYTASQLKRASNSGRIMLYIVPLRGVLDDTPIAKRTLVFPNGTCGICDQTVPLSLLASHAEKCREKSREDIEDEYQDTDEECMYDSSNSLTSTISTSMEDMNAWSTSPSSSWSSSPVCCVGIHTSIHVHNNAEAPLPQQQCSSTTASTSKVAPEKDWKTVVDPRRAFELFTQELLKNKNGENKFVVDLRKDKEEQDWSYMSFYKRNNVEWALPLRCTLEGDIALGTGVNRHVMSTLMHKLRTGFLRDFANGPITKIFEGQPDHLVPVNSFVMVESELFLMAGRMLGHCFLYGGPGFPGLSPAIKHVLCGGSMDTVKVTPEDCPNLDIRDTIQLLAGNSELVGAQRDSVVRLCMAWDLPPPTPTNRTWLHEKMLLHAVLERSDKQVKQLQKGLKEIGIWPLLSSREDVVKLLFPCEKEAEVTPQMILSSIAWPPLTPDSEDDDYDLSIEAIARITTYFKIFIGHASSEQLKELLCFWVGWEVPPQKLIVRVDGGRFPRALTCSETLRLPGHYTTYKEFESDLVAAVSTYDTGFGLV
ncbi:uncharacterized protein LOC121680825 isoform X2 [Alosa sapidissima]|uniref:uncharacterized protein LOC121680825 isoform X2 n=1 Tax=Alosa sapidissima TaxID=34773 RepID=UPI001C0964B0|nr:uncharacterized protein LOC121680825 isoform X2 [Alosa sapidissima]